METAEIVIKADSKLEAMNLAINKNPTLIIWQKHKDCVSKPEIQAIEELY